ncbi:MAG TPA: glycosyltransferase family 4 protein [Pirellulales bacterium]|nr:glycosyltransferase family 4 protein [Pirellulales bacterium]
MQDLFQAMAVDSRFELRVHYLEMAAPDTYWDQASLPDYAEVLPGKWFWLMGGRIHVNPQAAQRILTHRPEVIVVTGYSGITNQLVMRALRRRKIPWIFYGERPGLKRRGVLGQALRAVARHPAVRWPSAIAAVGTSAVAQYQVLAPAHCPVENIPYCCNLQPFLSIDRGLRFEGPIRFLYCGQLIERKGVDLLLDAYLKLSRGCSSTTLTFVGEGPLRDELSRRVPGDLQERIHFAGFQPVNQLPKWFANSDVLVLPSRHDGWGVVVNQAIAAGLAVVCSDAVGAAKDLVEDGQSGLIFPAGDGSALANCMAQLASDPEKVKCMGSCSRELAAAWTPEQAVERWYNICSQVVVNCQHEMCQA